MLISDDPPLSTDLQDGPSFLQKCVCLIPAYNEAEMIGNVVTKLRNHFQLVLVVDDGSSDKTAEMARLSGARVVTHCVNIGQGGALATGFTFIKQLTDVKYVVTFDADGQHAAEDAVNLVRTLEQDSLDVVLGTRFDSKEPIGMPRLKRIILKTLILIRKFIMKSPFSDIHNGLRAFTIETLDQIQITQFGMAHASEISSQILKLNLNCKEIPVTIAYTDYSKRKGQSILNGINILVDLIWR